MCVEKFSYDEKIENLKKKFGAKQGRDGQVIFSV